MQIVGEGHEVFILSILSKIHRVSEREVDFRSYYFVPWLDFAIWSDGDTSGVALGAVPGHRLENILHPIYYASKELNPTHKNYTVTKQ